MLASMQASNVWWDDNTHATRHSPTGQRRSPPQSKVPSYHGSRASNSREPETHTYTDAHMSPITTASSRRSKRSQQYPQSRASSKSNRTSSHYDDEYHDHDDDESGDSDHERASHPVSAGLTEVSNRTRTKQSQRSVDEQSYSQHGRQQHDVLSLSPPRTSQYTARTDRRDSAARRSQNNEAHTSHGGSRESGRPGIKHVHNQASAATQEASQNAPEALNSKLSKALAYCQFLSHNTCICVYVLPVWWWSWASNESTSSCVLLFVSRCMHTSSLMHTWMLCAALSNLPHMHVCVHTVSMHVYICIYIYKHTYAHTCMHACLNACMYVHVQVYIPCVYAYAVRDKASATNADQQESREWAAEAMRVAKKQTFKYDLVCMYVCMCVCVYVCMFVLVCVFMHISAHSAHSYGHVLKIAPRTFLNSGSRLKSIITYTCRYTHMWIYSHRILSLNCRWTSEYTRICTHAHTIHTHTHTTHTQYMPTCTHIYIHAQSEDTPREDVEALHMKNSTRDIATSNPIPATVKDPASWLRSKALKKHSVRVRVRKCVWIW